METGRWRGFATAGRPRGGFPVFGVLLTLAV